MTLAVKLWIVDGQNNLPGNIARLMLRSATRNGQGVVEIGDLRVEELDVPGTAVVVRDGAAIVRGAEEVWQGSYWAYNIGDEQVTLTATGSTGPRSDLVYLRIEDPTVAGGGWDHDPDTDPKAYFVVKEGVSANTTAIPSGESGIPLARIDRPASTGTVTQDNIVDLRRMVDPRTHTETVQVDGDWDTADSVGNTTEYEQWPNGASWPIDVPEWASQAVITVSWNGVQYTSQTAHARGFLRAQLGTQATGTTRYDVPASTAQWLRMTLGIGKTIDIPQAMRGTTQTLELQGAGGDGFTGKIESDGGTSVVATVLFREVPRYDVPDRSPQ